MGEGVLWLTLVMINKLIEMWKPNYAEVLEFILSDQTPLITVGWCDTSESMYVSNINYVLES